MHFNGTWYTVNNEFSDYFCYRHWRDPSQKNLIIVGLSTQALPNSRCSTGKMFVDLLIDALGGDKNSNFQMVKFSSFNIHLLNPSSAQDVKTYLEENMLTNSRILVICDDLFVPFGERKYRKAVKNGTGHKELSELLATIGNNLELVKIGIGRPKKGASFKDYVQAEFPPEEKEQFFKHLNNAIDNMFISIFRNTSFDDLLSAVKP
jgi:peptidyl-tRNA hydrolase